MKWFFLLVLINSLSPHIYIQQEECDCSIFPFKPNPPCVNKCAGTILKHLSTKQLKNLLGLSTSVAENVTSHQSNIELLSDCKIFLSNDEYNEVETAINDLDEDTFKKIKRILGL